MIDRMLTFVGSVLSVAFWFQLISILDVSSPTSKQTDGSTIGRFAILAVVGLIFVAADILINRQLPESFRRLLLGVFLVAVAGSIGMMLVILVPGLILGYVPIEWIGSELFGALFLMTPLVATTFFSILTLKAVFYFVLRTVNGSSSFS